MWIIHLAFLLITQVDSAIIFLSGILANTSVYCATVNKLLGPQAHEAAIPTIAELLFLDQPDSCTADNTNVSSKIVYLTVSGACADEKTYEDFYARGAVAIVRPTDFLPGSDYNLGNPAARLHPSWNDMLFVEISGDDAPSMLASDGALVSVTPDANLWQPVYRSATYQAFLRWIPSFIAFVTFGFAFSFLSQHCRILRIKYLITTPVERDTTSNWLSFLRHNANVSVVVLSIEALSSATLMIIWSVGGFWSTSNLSAPVIRFFATQLSGLAYVTTILSARFWRKIVAELRPTKKPGSVQKPSSFLKRALLGKIMPINIITLCGPLLLDLVMAVGYATYRDREDPGLLALNALIFVSIDITLAIYFLRGSIMLQIQMKSLVDRTQGHCRHLREFRLRTIRCVSGLGICMLFFSGGTLFFGLAPKYCQSPEGWRLSWSIITNARISQSLFHIIMFRPASRSISSTTPTPNPLKSPGTGNAGSDPGNL